LLSCFLKKREKHDTFETVKMGKLIAFTLPPGKSTEDTWSFKRHRDGDKPFVWSTKTEFSPHF